ncbi:hypothetical protein BGX23_001413, partial [Mortierella sp. AD031]
MSSMENFELWSPTSVSSITPGSPTTVSRSRYGSVVAIDNNFLPCSAGSGSIIQVTDAHKSDSSNNYSSTMTRSRQNSDQEGGCKPAAAVGRLSLDQQSIHPLELDPNLATTTEEEEEEEEKPMLTGEQEATTTMTLALSEQQQGDRSLEPTTPIFASSSMALATSTVEGGAEVEASSSTGDLSASRQQPKGQQQQRLVIRKKTSFAAKLRNVFNSKSMASQDTSNQPANVATTTTFTTDSTQQTQTQEDIISLMSGDDMFSGKASTVADMVALMDQHRGSVSSASSIDTVVDVLHHANESYQTETPSTSPEITPCGSPTDMSTLNTVMSGQGLAPPPLPSTSVPAGIHPISVDPLLASPPSALDVERATHVMPTSQTGSDVTSMQQGGLSSSQTQVPLPTRTVKKRLSFASISSFFSPRGGNSSINCSLQEARAKQQRAASVPHVENPLVSVGRQIAGFQRRHSLNDLHDNNAAGSSKISRVGVNPWEKDSPATPASTNATTANNPVKGGRGAVVVPKPVKKLSLNSVFKKKKKSATPKPESPIPAKPLRSALARRSPASAGSQTKVHLVHRSSRRSSASIRSQNSAQRRHHRHSHHSHHHNHHHHRHQHQQSHSHNSHPHTDPFARLAEANQALASLSRTGSEDLSVLRQQQQQLAQQYANGEFSTSLDEFDFCASPLSYEGPGGLPPLDTQGLCYSHSEEDEMMDSPGAVNGSMDGFSTPPTPRVLPVVTKLGRGSSSNPDGHPITFGGRSQYTQQRNGLSTLSPSSSRCSYSSSSSDGAEGSFKSTSDDDESCSSSSCSSQQESVAPETCAMVVPSGSSSVGGSRRNSNTADRPPVFNPLLPASAARVS